MTTQIRNLIASLLLVCVGLGAAHAYPRGPSGPPPDGRGKSGGEFAPPANFMRPPRSEWDQRYDGSRDAAPEVRVPLNDAVSMVQQRFNATAVKTDTVMESGQVVYRIRLLSADRSRVWTVSVDARTGRIN